MNEQIPIIKRTIYTIFLKRLFDILISGLVLIVFSPIFIVLIILELKYHGKPVFFIQERPGLNEKIFKMYKFRSMTNQTDNNGKLLPGCKRLTKFGKILRKTSLDELPELINIFKGDMSIIGPRPLSVKYLSLYSERHRFRHAVRPGLACMKIVGERTKAWTWGEQFENDVWYVENVCLLVDIKMVFAVLHEVLNASDERSEATREAFDGSNLYSNDKEE